MSNDIRNSYGHGLSVEALEARKDEILADIEAGEFVSIDNVERKMKLAQEAAKNFNAHKMSTIK